MSESGRYLSPISTLPILMKRGTWMRPNGGSPVAAGAVGYGFNDRHNLIRSDLPDSLNNPAALLPEEWKILALGSLAPGGHNTQPWFVQRMEPWHWIIGNDSTCWLPAVDHSQRETLLSIGAFVQNLEYAASAYGYLCLLELLAANPHEAQIMGMKLDPKAVSPHQQGGLGGGFAGNRSSDATTFP